MSEATVHFLQQRRKALNYQLSSLQSALEDLTGPHKFTEAEVDCLVQTTGEQSITVLKAQIEAWQSFLGKDREYIEAQEAEASMSTPQISDEVRRSKARERLAKMGGMPFGGAFNLPEGELKQRRQALNSTASPAAREMARLRETGTLAIAPPENPSWIARGIATTAQEKVTVSS